MVSKKEWAHIIWAMRLCVARSSKTRTPKIRCKQKEKDLWNGPSNNGTNRYNSRVRVKNEKQAMTPKSKRPQYEILQPCLTARILGYVIIWPWRSLSYYFSNNSYLKHLATGSKRDTEDCHVPLKVYQNVLHVPGIWKWLACKLLCIMYPRYCCWNLCLLRNASINDNYQTDWKLSVVLATCNVYQMTWKK